MLDCVVVNIPGSEGSTERISCIEGSTTETLPMRLRVGRCHDRLKLALAIFKKRGVNAGRKTEQTNDCDIEDPEQ